MKSILTITFFVCIALNSFSQIIFDGSFNTTDAWVDENNFTSNYGGGGYNSCIPREENIEIIEDDLMGTVAKFTLMDGDFCNSGNDRHRMKIISCYPKYWS